METKHIPSKIYEVYSDESNYNSKDYASICLISLDSTHTPELNERLKLILKESGVNEFKWRKLRSARDKFCANKIIDYIFRILNTYRFRIDVVVWNIQERKIKFKDNDIISLKKMYHQILKNVLKMRWSGNIQWAFFPDMQNNIDWKESKNILDNVSLKIIIKDNEIEFKKDFNINLVQEVDSKKTPLCQVADLFAGLAIFSHINKSGLPRNIRQQSLLDGDKKSPNTGGERIDVFNHLLNAYKNANINLISNLPLESWPTDPINFWNFKFNEEKNISLGHFIKT